MGAELSGEACEALLRRTLNSDAVKNVIKGVGSDHYLLVIVEDNDEGSYRCAVKIIPKAVMKREVPDLKPVCPSIGRRTHVVTDKTAGNKVSHEFVTEWPLKNWKAS